jgi:hypothetical protein
MYFSTFRDEFYVTNYLSTFSDFHKICLFVFSFKKMSVFSHKKRNICLSILVLKFIKKTQFSVWWKLREIKKKAKKEEIMRAFVVLDFLSKKHLKY